MTTEILGMLDFMRKNAGTWMVKALLAAIVVVFVFWGVGSWTGQREGRVATVNGEVISLEEYRRAYGRLIDQARQNFGAALSDELVKAMNLPEQALEQLIERTLLRQAAGRLNVGVSDEGLARAIRDIDAFKENGAFNRRRYEQVLAANRLTPEQFEASQRELMVTQKLIGLVTDMVKVSEAEVEEWYRWNHAAVRLDYVLVPFERASGLTATPEEIQAHYDRQKESYRTEPEVKVRYARIAPEDFLEQAAVAPAEVQEYYETHPERFVVHPTVEARHILIKAAADADPETDRKARERILALLALARQGKDFAALAREHSEDPSRENGGSLGAFRREAMVQPFADAAFALAPGEISEPVRTPFGWHLIKVEKANPERVRGLEEARPEIETQLKTERARSLAYDAAEALYDAAAASGGLEGAAAARAVALKTTEFVTRRATLKGIPQGAQLLQAAFQLPPGELGDIQELSDGFYLFEVVEKRAPRIPELSEVAEKVSAEVVREKQVSRSREDAEALLAELRSGVALDQAARKFGLAAKQSDLLRRSESIPALGGEPEVLRVAFGLSPREPLPPAAIRTPKGFCVIRLVERQAPPAEGLAAEKAQIQDRLLQQKKAAAWQAWLEDLRRGAAIERRQNMPV
jgi:peptidyl-prolyl cis-trans isomerase D